MVEDGAVADGERAVCADGETIEIDGVLLDGVVELELVVCHDLALAVLLVLEHTVLEGDDGGAAAGFGLSLRRVSVLSALKRMGPRVPCLEHLC